MVAVSLDKKVFATMKGEFSEFKLSAFITGVMYGKESFANLPKDLPKLMKADPWDGGPRLEL